MIASASNAERVVRALNVYVFIFDTDADDGEPNCAVSNPCNFKGLDHGDKKSDIVSFCLVKASSFNDDEANELVIGIFKDFEKVRTANKCSFVVDFNSVDAVEGVCI